MIIIVIYIVRGKNNNQASIRDRLKILFYLDLFKWLLRLEIRRIKHRLHLYFKYPIYFKSM